MENATKALLMAGGVLIGILVISALMLMFNNLGVFQQGSTEARKATQIAKFNQDFAKYADEDNIKGTDIISLANKVIDYNTKDKDDIANSVDYNKKITLTITNLGVSNGGFSSKYGTKMFGTAGTITRNVKNSLSELYTKVDNFITWERDYGLSAMSKVSANYELIYGEAVTGGSNYTANDAKNNRKDNLQRTTGQTNGDTLTLIQYQTIMLKAISGKSNIVNLSKSDIDAYREYTEFKGSTFESNGTPTYDNGQIIGLSFKFVR